MEDTLAIRAFVEREKPRTAVLAGGGFISLELAENLAEMGVQVTIVQRIPQVMHNLDYDMATFLHAHLRQKGMTLRLGASVAGFRQEGKTITTLVEGGADIPADLAILAVGVTPESTLAQEAGLALGARGSIAVNDWMQTSDPDIYAVGDAVEIPHLVTGQKTLTSLAGPANKQGRVAADHLCGRASRYPGAQGSSVIKVCDLTVASTGLNEKSAREAGLTYEKIVLSPMNHAGYYPGGKMMTMKVLYEKGSLRILGAQIVGYEGVDKRIDVLATAMQMGEGHRPHGTGPGLRAPLLLRQGPGEHGGVHGREHRGRPGQAVPLGPGGRPAPGRQRHPAGCPHPHGVQRGLRPGVCEHPGGRAAPAAGGNRSPEARLRHVPERTAELSGLPHPGPARV